MYVFVKGINKRIRQISFWPIYFCPSTNSNECKNVKIEGEGVTLKMWRGTEGMLIIYEWIKRENSGRLKRRLKKIRNLCKEEFPKPHQWICGF